MVTRVPRAHVLLLCAPLLVCALSTASAADKPTQGGQPGNAAPARIGPPGLDANGDGAVDLAELTAREPSITAAEFAAVDTNHDGLLSREELRSAMPKLRLMRVDTNKDGAVSPDELRAAALRDADARFKTLDRNGDGKLTADEFPRAVGGPLFNGPGGNGPGPGHLPGHPPPR